MHRRAAHPGETGGTGRSIRTDLAMEAAEAAVLTAEDIEQKAVTRGGARVTDIVVKSERGERELGRSRGRYVTVEVPPLSDDDRRLEEYAVLTGEYIASLLPKTGTVLVVGLGNIHVTPDALGPQAADMVLATRHIGGEFARSTGLDDLRPVAVLTPGVLGQTGIESGEVVRGVCQAVRPAAVVAIDALAARSLTRLGCTVQLADTGIAPGSGIGNNRRRLDRELLGVPVIAVGVPTVVDARTLVAELTGREADEEGASMIVTPREIDLVIDRASRLVAMAVNRALQPSYSPLELISIAT